MKTNEEALFMGTLFSNCMAKQGTKEFIFDWFTKIKNGAYKAPVEEIRALTAKGEKDKAAEKKRMLPAIVPAGFLPKGRTESDPIHLSRLGVADYDCHDFEWSAAARDALIGMPGIIGAYITINGGLRVIYFLPLLQPEDFIFFCNVVLETLDQKLHYPHDKQVTQLTHLISASYDPDAWFVSPEEATVFPVEKALENIQKEVYMEADGKLPATPVFGNTDEGYSLDNEINNAYLQLTATNREAYTKTKIDEHLSRFLGRYPLVEGCRNTNLLHLGQYAHFMRYNTDELEYLIYATHRLIGCKEYTQKRIRQCVCWGYRHNKKQMDPEKYAKQFGYYLPDENPEGKGQLGQLGHKGDAPEEQKLQVFDFQEKFNKVVMESCPYLPSSLYDKIPSFFKDLLIKTENPRDTDMSFIFSLGAMTAAMPNVTVQVRQKRYSTNVYLLGIAPAGAGKGVATLCPRLLSTIQKKLEANYQSEKQEHERKSVLWQNEIKAAFKEQREPNWEVNPGDEPVNHLIIAEPQTSRSDMISKLAENPHGIFMFTSELNVINESLHSDCGHHAAELAGINMNERQGYSYKHDHQRVVAQFPKLTLMATGTPSQYVNFIGNTHAGMESRAYTMLASSYPSWISWADEDETLITKIDEAYQKAADKVADMYEYLIKFPTHVRVPKELRALCDQHCKFFFERLIEEGHGNLDSIVKRLPILIARFCGVFCAMRKYEMGITDVDMEATPEDVEIALQVSTMLLRHTCIATTMLVEDYTKINVLKSVFSREDLFKRIPDTFSVSEFTKLCVETNKYSPSTIKRTIRDWMERGYINRIDRGVYAKTGKKM